MPVSWGTHEATTRLLLAIIASQPGHKFDYNEIAKYFGKGTNYKSIWGQMKAMQDNAKLLRAEVDGGTEPGSAQKGQAISLRMGSDCSVSAIENRFRPLKRQVILINKTVEDGVDVATLGIGSGGAIAENFGEGVTAKGVSCRMDKLKKDVAAVLANSTLLTGTSAKKTPTARTRTPKSGKGSAKVKQEGPGNGEDDYEGMFQETPSKKAAMKVVKTGRIAKPARKTVSKSAINYIEEDSDEEIGVLKKEPGSDNDYGTPAASSASNHHISGAPTPFPSFQGGEEIMEVDGDHYYDADDA